MNQGIDSLGTTFAALADPTRRAILERLAEGEAPVGELGAPFAMTPQAVSRHLKVLEQSGLILRRVDRQRRIISLNPEALRTAGAWIDRTRAFWEGRLDALAAYLDRDAEDSERNQQP